MNVIIFAKQGVAMYQINYARYFLDFVTKKPFNFSPLGC